MQSTINKFSAFGKVPRPDILELGASACGDDTVASSSAMRPRGIIWRRCPSSAALKVLLARFAPCAPPRTPPPSPSPLGSIAHHLSLRNLKRKLVHGLSAVGAENSGRRTLYIRREVLRAIEVMLHASRSNVLRLINEFVILTFARKRAMSDFAVLRPCRDIK